MPTVCGTSDTGFSWGIEDCWISIEQNVKEIDQSVQVGWNRGSIEMDISFATASGMCNPISS